MAKILGAQTKEFFTKAGQALVAWCKLPENPSLPALIREEKGLDGEWVSLLVSNEIKDHVRRNNEQFFVLYKRTGLEELNPTKIPTETRNQGGRRSDLDIILAWSEEELENRRQEITPLPEEMQTEEALDGIADELKVPENPSVKEEKVLIQTRSESRTEKPEFVINVSEAIHKKAEELGIQISKIRHILDIDINPFRRISGGHHLVGDLTNYAKLYYHFEIQEADPRLVPLIRTAKPWTDVELNNWIEENKYKYRQAPVHKRLRALSPTATTSQEALNASNKDGFLASENSRSLKNWCNHHGYKSVRDLLERELGLTPGVGSRISSGRGLAGKEAYAEVYFRTGISGFDPRKIPASKGFVPKANSGQGAFIPRVRAINKSEWQRFLGKKSEQDRLRFEKLANEWENSWIKPIRTGTPVPGLLQSAAPAPAKTIETPAKTGQQLPPDSISNLGQVGLALLDVLIDGLAQKVADKLAVNSDFAQRLGKSQPIQDDSSQIHEVVAPKLKQDLSFAAQMQVFKGILDQELVDVSSEVRDKKVTQYRAELAPLLVLLRAIALPQAEQREVSISEYKARFR